MADSPRSKNNESDGSEKQSPLFFMADEKKLLRKIDLKVMPMLFVIYVAAFLDRVNISNALTMNLPKDLHLIGIQENVALTIFFVPYVLFEIPSNILLRRFKPHIWFSSCILFLVQNYGGLLATRFLLGLAEAGIFPGSEDNRRPTLRKSKVLIQPGFYLISFWYRREEAQKRFTVYWCSVLTANMFGGLLASAIANMNGIGGYSNWRWIFILEGIATMLIGITAFFFVADFPENSHWLTEEERHLVLDRVSQSRPDPTQRITLADVALFFRSPSNIIGGVIYFGEPNPVYPYAPPFLSVHLLFYPSPRLPTAIIVPTYAFAYFAPTIIKALGYSTVQTQLHTVPPVAAALALALILAYLSDRTQLRSPYILFCSALTISGLAILISVHNTFSAQYAAICLVAMGAFSAGPLVICWYVMNLQGHAARSIGTAWMISFGNTGGVVATFAFLATEAPGYTQGYAACLAVSAVGLVAVLAYAGMVWRGNKGVVGGGGKEVRLKRSL
ncbi:hypothetical protein MMC10_009317 [Thelotrema lepadinum]|nr:hypothetical protein [Thelotrema lepadinum]